MERGSNCIVLLSGGQDSTTCLYWALENFETVQAIGFNYNQRHKVELEHAKIITERINVPFKIINVNGLLNRSSLTDTSIDHFADSEYNSDLPASFTLGRNILFLTIASIHGNGCTTDIVTGVCQTDFSGYPDCRKTTMDSLQVTLSLGLGVGDIRIHTPLMYLTKAETWRMAKELGCIDVIINDTITDYNGTKVKNEWGYGVKDNPATLLRAKGYYEAKANGWI